MHPKLMVEPVGFLGSRRRHATPYARLSTLGRITFRYGEGKLGASWSTRRGVEAFGGKCKQLIGEVCGIFDGKSGGYLECLEMLWVFEDCLGGCLISFESFRKRDDWDVFFVENVIGTIRIVFTDCIM